MPIIMHVIVIIYKVTNNINGKIYVGQTIKSLKKRSLEHKSDSKRNSYAFPNAIKKYGFENFKWEVLETCSSQDELDKAEQKWIKTLHSTENSVGYNICNGGNPGKEIGRKNLSKLWKTQEFRNKMKKATRRGVRKLNDAQISEMKAAHKMGFGVKVLEEYYHISNSGVQSVVYEKTWKEYPPADTLGNDTIKALNNIKEKQVKSIKQNAERRRAICPSRVLSSAQISKIKYLKTIGATTFQCSVWFSISHSLSEKIFSGEKFPGISVSAREDFDALELENYLKLINEAKQKRYKKQLECLELGRKSNNNYR